MNTFDKGDAEWGDETFLFLLHWLCCSVEVHKVSYKRVPWDCMHVLSLSCAQLFVTPWTVAHQASLSMGFPSKNTEVGSYFLFHGAFLTQGWNRVSHNAGKKFFTVWTTREAYDTLMWWQIFLCQLDWGTQSAQTFGKLGFFLNLESAIIWAGNILSALHKLSCWATPLVIVLIGPSEQEVATPPDL